MNDLITSVLPYIPSGAIPVIICFCFYFYIQSKRKETKVERDKDSQDIREHLLKHDFMITELKDKAVHQSDRLDDLSQQINILNSNVVRLTTQLESLGKVIEKLESKC